MPVPAKIPFRQYAKEHVEKAKGFLSEGGSALRYACLELRLAIEALAYEILQTYAEDDDPAVAKALKKWKPREVLENLRKYDPLIEISLRVEFRLAESGETDLPSEPTFVGTQVRFEVEWADTAHHQMSQLLHQRTIAQIQDGNQIDEAVARRDATGVLEKLERILASEMTDIRSDYVFKSKLLSIYYRQQNILQW